MSESDPLGSSFEDRRFRDVRFVVAKITHRCNLACSYCYEDSAPGTDMDISTFRLLSSKVMRNSDRPLVRFVLHGGEPSLVGLDWLNEAVGFLETEGRIFRKAVKIGLQSNLLAMDEAKLLGLKRLGITLGASIDGPEDIPSMRPLGGRAIERYRLARSLGVRTGLLMTINGSNWSHFGRIMKWLREEMEVSWFRANTVTAVGRGKDLPSLEPGQVFRAQREIIDTMIQSGGKILEENMMGEIRRFLRPGGEREPDTLCNRRDCGAGSSVLSITPEGNILPCGRFSWNDQAFFLGNAREDADEGRLSRFQATRNWFHDLSPELWEPCTHCPARVICSFGCRAFIARSESGANVDCQPTRLRYEYFTSRKPQLERLLSDIDSQGAGGTTKRRMGP